MSWTSWSLKHKDFININVLCELIFKAVIGIHKWPRIESLSLQLALSLVLIDVSSDHLKWILVWRIKDHTCAVIIEFLWSDYIFGQLFDAFGFFLVSLVKESAINFLEKLEFELIKIILVNDIVARGAHETMIALATYQVLISKGLLEVSDLLFEASIFAG